MVTASAEKEIDMLLGIGLSVLIASVVLYMVLLTMVLPKKMIKAVYPINTPADRGVSRCTFEGKLCNVYASSKENKPYIKQYLLLREQDHKILRCNVAPGVEYIDYDIILFDRYDKVLGVMNVKEDILGKDVTRSTRLPKETSYIRIVVRQVNRTKRKVQKTFKVKGSGIFKYFLVTVLFTAVEAFVVRACCSYAFGDVYRESFLASRYGFLVIGVFALCVGLFGAFSASIGAGRQSRK